MLKIKNVVLVTSLLGLAATAQAQTLSRGITAGLPSGGGAEIGYVHFKDANNAIRIEGGTAISKTQGQDVGMSLGVDVGFRKYIQNVDKLRVFTEPNAFLGKSTGAGKFFSKVTLGGGYGLGAEYQVTNNFTIGAKVGATLTISNEFKDFAITTGTSKLNVNYYW